MKGGIIPTPPRGRVPQGRECDLPLIGEQVQTVKARLEAQGAIIELCRIRLTATEQRLTAVEQRLSVRSS